MAPLASPETLSEISSLSSRASFFLPKDQSPLFRLKNGRPGHSSSLHRHHGSARNGKGYGSGNGLHNRSFSCTYPENGREVSIIGTASCQGGLRKLNGQNGDVDETLTEQRDCVDDVTPTHYPNNGCGTIDYESHLKYETHSHPLETAAEGPDSGNAQKKTNGESMKRVSFNLKRKFASRDSGCSVGDNGSFPTTPAGGRPSTFEPTYPIFSHQTEYGVPSLNSPHYTYCGQSPVDSPDVVFATPQQCRHSHGQPEGASSATAAATACPSSDMFTFPEFRTLTPPTEEKLDYHETHH